MHIILYGPTLSDKSKIANFFANKYKYQVVNIDAYQVYKEIPILSAADDCYLSKYYSVYDEPYSIGKLLFSLKNLPKNQAYIFVGGSSMYAHSLKNGIHQLPPVSKINVQIATEMFFANKIQDEGFVADYSNAHRVIRDYSFFLETGYHLSEYYSQTQKIHLFKNSTFISVNRAIFDFDKIECRIDKMISQGLFDEINALDYDKLSVTAKKTLGLNDVYAYLNNEISLNVMKSNMISSTKKLIKKQRTWQRSTFKYWNSLSIQDFYDKRFDFRKNYQLNI